MDKAYLNSIVERTDDRDWIGNAYNITMFIAITLSLVPLMTHYDHPIFKAIDMVTCAFFIIDYLLRWFTADYRSKDKNKIKAILLYPFTPMAIIDLLSILPSLSLINPAFKVVRITRQLKIIRVFKFLRYYEPLQIIMTVIRKEGKTLMTVVIFAVFYIFVCALVMFNIESEDPFFDTFFDAIYWSCCTLTTVGYGDIYPTSDIGRAFSMLSATVGIALVALPSGIITSGYLDELRLRRERERRAAREKNKAEENQSEENKSDENA